MFWANSSILILQLVFEIVTPTVVFKYCEDTASPGAVIAPYAAGIDVQDEGQERDAVYFDALNTWVICKSYIKFPLTYL